MTPENRETATQPGSITPERFARVRAIFEAAISRPAAERRLYIEDACDSDNSLRREVEAMLAADERVHRRPSSSAPEEGRFPAGIVLAGRYRILGLLGHGGMGEVYKAFDLILNQTVALKFLAPGHISESALVRFRNEVRIARQVSHPNVCRVYDLGMVEGLHFLSMEYIDGEDLASLLRRIGRLPQDKAIEFTRKICAGLSAAHERGVLHRDLKPANIMIDGRGQVRITDFGLAGLAAEIPLSDLRSGTPAYMSPEQKTGKEVTTRSDIYALGLVLHEMFTGKARHETQSSPTELVKDLEPTIERLILRCLEEEPKRRPNSALNVAMALPGADPIAAALAAGETPSPEMVAASTEKEGFSPRSATAWFVFIVIALIAGAWLAPKTMLLARAPLPIPPDGLAFRAQDILRQLGYAEPPHDTAYGIACCPYYYPSFLGRYEPARRNVILASHQPPVIYFWYRQHRDDLVADHFLLRSGQTGWIDLDSPANTEPGMIRMILDAKGRLVRLDVRPWVDLAGAGIPPDPAPLFAAAGLDPARFRPVPTRTIPPMASDASLAWVGSYSPDRPEQIRVEAAFWRGRPVFADIGELQGREAEATPTRAPILMGYLLVFFLCLAGATAIAWHNLRTGRSDRGGAAKLAGAGFLIIIAAWAIGAHHVARLSEFGIVLMALSWGAFVGAALWMLYVAIEPYVRRNWPDALISWTRFQAGQFRNPLVASHILAGIALAVAVECIMNDALRIWLPAPPQELSLRSDLTSAARFVVTHISDFTLSMFTAMGLLVLTVLLRLLVRKVQFADMLACMVVGLIGLGSFGTGFYHNAAGYIFWTLTTALWLWGFRRFGLLNLFTAYGVSLAIHNAPVLFSTWFSGWMIAVQLLALGVAGWALWVIIGARKPRSTESSA